MKTYKVILILFCLVLSQPVYCDVIPEDSHYVNKCIKITNTTDYPDVAIVGRVLNLLGDNYSYFVDTDCLDKGYKFNTFEIYAINRILIDGIDIEEFEIENHMSACKSNLDLDPFGGYLHDSIPIDEIEEFYMIMGFTDTSVVLHNWKTIQKHNNETEDSVFTFDYTGNLAELNQNMLSPIPHNTAENYTQVYPNPVDDLIVIECRNIFRGVVNIEVLSTAGRTIERYSVQKSDIFFQLQIPSGKYSQGNYFIKMQFGDLCETKQIRIN